MLDRVFAVTKETPVDSYEMGAAARFTRLDDKWGIKLYNTEYMRDKTYRFQKLVNSIDRAPALGDKFSVVLPDGEEYFGYITECITKTYCQGYMDERGIISFEDFDDDAYSEMYDMMEESEEFKSLIRDIESVGITTCDMHVANVGYMPDGRLVAIDFSHEDEY